MDRITSDVSLLYNGPFIQFTGLSKRAYKWLKKNTDTQPYQWFGTHSVAIEVRFAYDIKEAMIAAGFVVVMP